MKSTHLNINFFFLHYKLSHKPRFLKILGIKAFPTTEVVFCRSRFCHSTGLSRVLIFFQCGMTVEMKGWGLDNKNCSLSMWYLIPFCDKSVGCGSHKTTRLLWIEEFGLSDGLSNCFISTAVAKDTEGIWQLRCRAYEITNFGRKTSFWPFKRYEYGPF